MPTIITIDNVVYWWSFMAFLINLRIKHYLEFNIYKRCYNINLFEGVCTLRYGSQKLKVSPTFCRSVSLIDLGGVFS